jgi:hypothetical protein
MTDVTRFKAIFSGLDTAYAAFRTNGAQEWAGRARPTSVVKEPLTDDLWANHLEGIQPCLGVIPIRADNTCTWGCIDVDQYPLGHARLVQEIRELELPLIVFRSKSGGAHIFRFSTEPIPASEMRSYLKGCAAALEIDVPDIFPRQDELKNGLGSYLYLPYFGGNKTTRYAFHDYGAAATLDEFYALYDQWVRPAGCELPLSVA